MSVTIVLVGLFSGAKKHSWPVPIRRHVPLDRVHEIFASIFPVKKISSCCFFSSCFFRFVRSLKVLETQKLDHRILAYFLPSPVPGAFWTCACVFAGNCCEYVGFLYFAAFGGAAIFRQRLRQDCRTFRCSLAALLHFFSCELHRQVVPRKVLYFRIL